MVAIISGSCSEPLEGLDEARERWVESRIADYRWTIDKQCFCIGPGELEVTVRDEMPVRIVANGRPLDDFEELTVPLTINAFFDELATFDDADSVLLSFDPRFGYPIEVSVDQLENAIDDEVSYRVTGFEILDG